MDEELCERHPFSAMNELIINVGTCPPRPFLVSHSLKEDTAVRDTLYAQEACCNNRGQMDVVGP